MAFYYGLVSQRGAWRTTPQDIQHLKTPGPYTTFINPINQLENNPAPLPQDEPQIPQIPEIPIPPNPQDPAFTPQPTPQVPPAFIPQPTPQTTQLQPTMQTPQGPANPQEPAFTMANPEAILDDYTSGFPVAAVAPIYPPPPIAAEPGVIK